MRKRSEVNRTFLSMFVECEQWLAFIFDGEEAQTAELQLAMASQETWEVAFNTEQLYT